MQNNENEFIYQLQFKAKDGEGVDILNIKKMLQTEDANDRKITAYLTEEDTIYITIDSHVDKSLPPVHQSLHLSKATMSLLQVLFERVRGVFEIDVKSEIEKIAKNKKNITIVNYTK